MIIRYVYELWVMGYYFGYELWDMNYELFFYP